MWIVVTAICSFVVILPVTMLCLCWRKKTQKNDLLGLDGLVTQKNPDENVNHLPSAIVPLVTDNIVNTADDFANDANKSRTVVVNNPRRSLPDIPSDGVQSDGDIVNYEPSGDNSSDLYATVEPYHNSVKRHTLPNGIENRPSISQHSSISQADDRFSPYARVKEHPYDKLRKTEHPYACVQASSSQEQEENSSGEGTPRPAVTRPERLSAIQSLIEPTVPCRSRRSSNQSGVGSDIPAASAVAGGISANQELPYMTPPLTQPNFSGDSQDSSKGYTSITVREPLANIRAQTKALNKNQGDLDPHYSTVSDDSDDMYTTIPDANNPIYTSGSETYAQIQPPQVTVAAEVNPEPSTSSDTFNREREKPLNNQVHDPVPHPPNVNNLKHANHTHSRQASSSSSIGILSSPKPEKRQANSPLPPPPPSAIASDPNSEKLPIKNLEEMYAKVHKSKKKNDKDEDAPIPGEIEATTSIQSTEDQRQMNDFDIKTDHLCLDHNYETLRKLCRKGSDPGYEKLKPKDKECPSEPGYDTINGPDSILSSDPGYEVLKHHHSEVSSEVDPNYEQLRHRTSNNGDATNTTFSTNNNLENHGYSVVNKQAKSSSPSEEIKSKTSSSYDSDARDLSVDEPNYESMPSESLSDHNYAVLKSNGSESDPNYESVNSNDPNYESVKYLDVSLDEPPYERLQDEESSRTDSNPSKSEGTTDLQRGSSKKKEKYKKNSDPDYETIKNELGGTEGSNNNVQLENDFDGIVQV